MPRGVPKSGKRKKRASPLRAAGRLAVYGSTRYTSNGGKAKAGSKNVRRLKSYGTQSVAVGVGNAASTGIGIAAGRSAAKSIAKGNTKGAGKKMIAGQVAGAAAGYGAAAAGRKVMRKRGYATRTKQRLSIRAAKKVGGAVRRKKK